MGWKDCIYNDIERIIKTCEHCGKKYCQESEDQIAGFRSRSEDICPYCGKSNGSSMSVEFWNSKIEQ